MYVFIYSVLSSVFLFFNLVILNSSFALTIPQHVPIPEKDYLEPQIQWFGSGIATLKPQWSSNSTPNTTIDFTDTTLIFGASKALFGNSDNRGVGSFVFGTLLTDQSLTGTGLPLFVHQAYVTFQNKWLEAYLGRTENPISQIIDLPTIRADDLIAFTSYLNPFSSSNVVQEHRYSNIASITCNYELSTYANVHIQHFIHGLSANTINGSTASNYGLNAGSSDIDSYGITIEQLYALPGLESIPRFQLLGIGYERVPLKTLGGNTQNVIYAGGIVNLNHSVTNHFEFRFQDIITLGSSILNFQSLQDTFAADSNLASFSFKYMHSPFGSPGYQLAITTGYRNYFGITNASSFGMAITGVKQLGQGFDFVAQYLLQWKDRVLASQYGDAAILYSIELGLVFNFQSSVENYLNPRKSLLNTRYGYIPN